VVNDKKAGIIFVITAAGCALVGFVFTTEISTAQDIKNNTAAYQDREVVILGEVSEITSPYSGRK